MASLSAGSGCGAQSRSSSDACSPDQRDPAIFRAAAADPECGSKTAQLFLRAVRSSKPRAAAAGRGKTLLPRVWSQIRVRSPVPARGQDTTVRLRLQNPGGDNQALDFAGAFVNFRDACVAVVALDGVLTAVTIAAVHLDRFRS